MDLCYDIYLTEAQMKKTEKQLDKTYDIIEKVSTQIAVKGKNKSKALLEEARKHIMPYRVFELHINKDNCQVYKVDAVADKFKKYEEAHTALLKEVNDIVDECVDCNNCESGACGCEAFRIKPKLRKLEVK